jgi:hypothetical protein
MKLTIKLLLASITLIPHAANVALGHEIRPITWLLILLIVYAIAVDLSPTSLRSFPSEARCSLPANEIADCSTNGLRSPPTGETWLGPTKARQEHVNRTRIQCETETFEPALTPNAGVKLKKQ